MAFQRSVGPSSPDSSTARMARSNATQAIIFECVKCRRGPRTSQMPSSGSRHRHSSASISASSSDHASGSGSTPMRRATCSESITSPYTSSWNWSTAAFPTRTGWAPP